MTDRPNRWTAARDPVAARERLRPFKRPPAPKRRPFLARFTVVGMLKVVALVAVVLVALDWLGVA